MHMESELWWADAKAPDPGCRTAVAAACRVRAAAGRVGRTLWISIVVEPAAVIVLAGGRGHAACAPGLSADRLASLFADNARWS